MAGATGIEPAISPLTAERCATQLHPNVPNSGMGMAGNDPASSELQPDANPSQLHSLSESGGNRTPKSTLREASYSFVD